MLHKGVFVMIPILEDIVITDKDIDDIEVLLGNVSFDEERRNVIKCLKSTDVQAFPGSGKTTVLIAKLAILAKKWPYPDKGICVLSHTNVARKEIETRLGKTDIGRRLLSYPHFIGTVHSFCNTFIALPWLRSNGYPVTIIDNDIVLKRRFHDLDQKTKLYFVKSNKSEFSCEATNFPITINIGCGEKSHSYQNVKQVVETSVRNGYYTFNELLYISRYALSQSGYFSKVIQTRFPILFIDEAQDTNELQWELLDGSFRDFSVSIKQAFGDANQAIFQSYGYDVTHHKFPSDKFLTISNSHRFGNSIAQLVDNLGVVKKGLVGELKDYERNSNRHTIFLYDKDNVNAVVPAYAEHILSCFSDEELDNNQNLGCYVVGMVHNKKPSEESDPQYPVSLIDYWSEYDPNYVKNTIRPRLFIEYFRLGLQSLSSSKSYSLFVEYLSDAFRRIINVKTDFNISMTGKAFNSIMAILSDKQRPTFRAELLLLMNHPVKDKSDWNNIVLRTKALLNDYFGIINIKDDFFVWNENEIVDCVVKGKTVVGKNVYTYINSDNNRTLPIHFASIHSEKGKTHLATMVVDTFWYARNIKSILPWLHTKTPQKEIKKQNAMRLKCHYVALTRARGLICIAMCKDSVTSKDRLLLEDAGWNIVDL